MPIPSIKKVKQQQINQAPKRKKLTVDSEAVDTFERCKTKHQKISAHLNKLNEEEISFQLDKDIDRSLKTLGIKYEKALDKILNQYQLTAEKPQTDQESFLRNSDFFNPEKTT